MRAVGFGKTGDYGAAGEKLLREHVKIESVSAAEFEVGEATCNGDTGGPALDESSGELVGVVSRGGPTCEGADVHNIYTRADAFAELIASAVEEGRGRRCETRTPACTRRRRRATPAPPARPSRRSDIGVRLHEGRGLLDRRLRRRTAPSTYCSRTCGTGDRCPNGYHCTERERRGRRSACAQ